MSDRWSSLAILHLVPVKRRSIPRLAQYCTWKSSEFQSKIGYYAAEHCINDKNELARDKF